jgi:hypothetical protein
VLAVWGEVEAVLLAMMMKWKIILVPIGVMHQGRYLQARIVVVVVDSGVVKEEETGRDEVNLIKQI